MHTPGLLNHVPEKIDPNMGRIGGRCPKLEDSRGLTIAEVNRVRRCNGQDEEAESNAALLSGAWNSYVKAFGPNAVEAAKSDALGEALELLRRVDGSLNPHIVENIELQNDIDNFLSRTKENA